MIDLIWRNKAFRAYTYIGLQILAVILMILIFYGGVRSGIDAGIDVSICVDIPDRASRYYFNRGFVGGIVMAYFWLEGINPLLKRWANRGDL